MQARIFSLHHKPIRLIMGLLSGLMVWLLLSASPAFGDTRTLRVGLYDREELYSMNANRVPQGYLIDYLKTLNQYVQGTPFQFEYVFGTPGKLHHMLLTGELDLTYSASKQESPFTPGIFLDSEANIALMQQVLYVADDNHNVYYEDFTHFNGLRVGFLTNSISPDRFQQYAAEHDFTYQAVYYANSNQLSRALKNKEIDAAVSNIYNSQLHKVVARLGNFPVHLTTAASQKDLMDTINQAQEKLLTAKPYFLGTLEERYYVNSNSLAFAFTREEAAFIQTASPIRVVCAPDNQPLEYYDDVNKTYRGVYVDFLQYVADKSGLTFTYQYIPSYAQAMEAVSEGKADVLLSTYNVTNLAQEKNLRLTTPYGESYMVMIGQYGTVVSETEIQTIALNIAYSAIAYYVKEWYPNWNLRYYPSTEACIQAVQDGVADFTLQDSNFITDMLLENQYADVGPVSSGRYKADISMAISSQCPPLLLPVLNKAIQAVSAAEYNTCVAQNQIAPMGFQHFYKLYHQRIQFFLGFILLGALMVLFWFQYKLYRSAYYDKLTHCKNGNYLLDKGKWILARGKYTTVVSLDIKKMKQINNSYGMPKGDHILLFVANELKHNTPKGTTVIRNTTDHFVLLLPLRHWEPQEIRALVEQILWAMRDYQRGDVSTKLHFAAGICQLDKSLSLSENFDQADIARKKAKEIGQTVLFFNESLSQQMKIEREIEAHMEKALENQEFQVYYQPKYNMQTKTIVGAEALVRWDSPELGFLAPNAFIPIFEKNGFIVHLDFYVLEHICTTMQDLAQQGVPLLPVSVNQSRIHINDPQYLDKLREILAHYTLPVHSIELELTESIFMENESIIDILQQVRAMGLRLSLDDFGSGYSSLNLLREIPIDVLKIDRVFLTELQLSQKTKAILVHMIKMTKDLGITPLCEGVETQEQAIMLQEMGCVLGQGYLFAKPMKEEEFLRLAYHLKGGNSHTSI